MSVAYAPPAERTAPPPPSRVPWPVILAIVAGHAALGLGMQVSPLLATAHAGLTIVGIVWVLAAARNPGPVVCAAAYVAGCEVLWRQTQAHVPWEVAKYLLMFIFFVGVLRFLGTPDRWGLPVLFICLLLPACVVPILSLGLPGAIDPLSFNLAGLFALAAGVMFLSHLSGPWTSLSPVVWCFVAPVAGTAAIAADGVRSLGAADFFNDSNFKSTGGFGPNQVSALLGLGVVLLILTAMRERVPQLRIAACLIAVWFIVQALLTFSRGGVLNTVVALLCALPSLIRRRDTGARILGLLILVGVVGVWLILPNLENLTGGELKHRFTDTRQHDVRTELIEADLHTFHEHPILGVGAGQSEFHRLDRLVIASHTEYTRLLAEHGVFGIAAIMCLVAMVIRAWRRQRIPFGHAWTAALVAWTATELWHASTRLAAVPFAFALGMFAVLEEGHSPELTRRP